MRILRLLLTCMLTTSASAQLLTENPLDALRNRVVRVLADAGVPFTAEQERQIALLIEEQRQASEDLFGEIMDFSSGVPEGEDRDRALAGIQWIYDEFRRRLPGYLTPDQREAWERFESTGAAAGAGLERVNADSARSVRIQEIRIVNNPLSAENNVGGGQGPGSIQRVEVIERGGSGAFHGNFSAAFQDDALNARNPAAANKPPYYERTISGSLSGPLIRNRFTGSFSLRDNRQENVGTVNALKVDGPVTLGITRPDVNRSLTGEGILQFSDSQSLHFGVEYRSRVQENQDVGDFTLPERGINSNSHSYKLDLRHISILSAETVYETRFSLQKGGSERKPIRTGAAIDVLDAFNGGGGLIRSETDGVAYGFGNLFYHAGNLLTIRAGVDGSYRRERSATEENFLGRFTFSDLESYRSGLPSQYEVNRGDPLLEVSHLEAALFLQNDFRLTNRLTVMAGVRYQVQTNVEDNHALDPRLAIAYAAGTSTVIRAGFGLIHEPFTIRDYQRLVQFDGKRLFGIRVSQPGWPDPFQSGRVETVPPPSRNVATPDLGTPYYATTLVSLEQNLPGNLQLTFSLDHNRGVKLKRRRNINTPLPGTITQESPEGVKPFPNEGDVIEQRTAGLSSHSNFRVGLRQRFSIFNVVVNYVLNRGYSDGSNNTLLSNAYDVFADWGPAGSSEKHNVTASINSRLPLGVYLTTTISAHSGEIYNVTTGTDDNRDGAFTDRPPGVGRNSETGPRYFEVGFNFSKAFQIEPPFAPVGGSSSQLSLFANVSNAFNRTNPRAPSGVRTSNNFGRSTSAHPPREVEVGMRFQF